MASIRERRMSSMGWTGTRSIDCPQEDGHVCRHWKAAPEGPLNELLPDHNYVENPHSNAHKNRLVHRHHEIDAEIGRAHVCTPVTKAHLVCRMPLANTTHNITTNVILR